MEKKTKLSQIWGFSPQKKIYPRESIFVPYP